MRFALPASWRKPFASLSNRLLLANLAVILTPLLVIGVFSYNTYAAHLERATSLYSNQILDKLKEQVDDSFKQIDRNLTSLWIQNDLQSLIDVPPDEWRNHPNEIYAMSKYITNLFGWREGNQGIFVLTERGAFYQEMTPTPLQPAEIAPDGAFRPEDRLRRSFWVSGPFLRSGSSSGAADRIISVNRPLLRLPNLEWSGTLRYDMNAAVIFRLFQSTRLGTSGYFLALDGNGEVLYKPDSHDVDPATVRAVIAHAGQQQEGGFNTAIDGVKYAVSYVTLSSTNWKLVGIVPWSEIVEGAGAVRRTLYVIGLLTLLVGSVLVLRLNGILLKPLHQLNRAIRKLGEGDFSAQLPIPSVQELQAVAVQYNRSAEQLGHLTYELYTSKLAEQAAQMRVQAAELHRQETELRMREAELSQLQAQINPHFLYNTLSCIDSMAEAGHIDELRLAVAKLSHMFRYSISSEDSWVTLEEEFRHVRAFVTLQQFRHADRIDVVIDVADDARYALIHRLSVQPLVENAYFHGVEPKLGRGHIRIAAWIEAEADTLTIEIADDGIGMRPELLAELQQFIADKGAAGGPRRYSGIRNVFRRLFLAYGDQCVITLASEEDRGTSVRIALPRLQ
ncbi:MAG: sensor histidine kinase [Paenibacillaceae bacterium]|nr:sensor histidine kinase [Paenibacillaceae bacterium]